MRPASGFHETSRNIDDERRIVRMFAGFCGVSEDGIAWLPDGYHIDSMLSKNGKYCFAEARRRNNRKDQYQTLILSLQKWFALVMHADLAPTFYVVQWDDGVFYYRVERETGIGYMKRNTGDPRDSEPVIHIPISKFQPIKFRPTLLAMDEAA